MALLEAEGVHVRFGDRVVLEEINLSVTEGELHGIMGPNGAGKTTFFNTLTGSVKPNRGRIRLDGDRCGRPRARTPLLARVWRAPSRS